MRMIFLTGLVVLLAYTMLIACGSSDASAVDDGGDTTEFSGDFPDPPEDQRHETLSIYMAWDGASGETLNYAFSADGIIEESGAPPSPDPEEGVVFFDGVIPGGRMLWFRGISPGDVVVTFTTYDANEEVVEIWHYTARVFSDLKVAQLHKKNVSFRD